MPVDGVPLNTASLPAVLAGPILRRLTRTSVCVWVALSKSNPIRLHVLNNDQEVTTAGITPVKVGSKPLVVSTHIELT
jgi:hypothetical protein